MACFGSKGMSGTMWFVVGLIITFLTLLLIIGMQIGISGILDKLLGRF